MQQLDTTIKSWTRAHLKTQHQETGTETEVFTVSLSLNKKGKQGGRQEKKEDKKVSNKGTNQQSSN